VQISQPQAAHCYIGNAVQNKCKDFIAWMLWHERNTYELCSAQTFWIFVPTQ
jgi:hypothetical protein